LTRLGEELRTKTYLWQPVRRLMIPKPGGGERPLSVPTIRDQVVQTAAKLVHRPHRCSPAEVGSAPTGLRRSQLRFGR
jgi:retron-type reverse transcriptase